MIRRDSSQDAEKARNYSSFWIEVAMGKDGSQGTSAILADENLELTDVTDMADLGSLPDLEEFVAPAPAPKPAKSKPAEKKAEAPRSLSSLADLANIDMLMKNSADLGDEAEVDLAADEVEDLDVPLTSDFDFDESGEGEEIEAESLEDYSEEEDFDDEEEDNEWGGGRKSKPSKPQKQRREQRKPY